MSTVYESELVFAVLRGTRTGVSLPAIAPPLSPPAESASARFAHIAYVALVAPKGHATDGLGEPIGMPRAAVIKNYSETSYTPRSGSHEAQHEPTDVWQRGRD